MTDREDESDEEREFNKLVNEKILAYRYMRSKYPIWPDTAHLLKAKTRCLCGFGYTKRR